MTHPVVAHDAQTGWGPAICASNTPSMMRGFRELAIAVTTDTPLLGVGGEGSPRDLLVQLPSAACSRPAIGFDSALIAFVMFKAADY